MRGAVPSPAFCLPRLPHMLLFEPVHSSWFLPRGPLACQVPTWPSCIIFLVYRRVTAEHMGGLIATRSAPGQNMDSRRTAFVGVPIKHRECLIALQEHCNETCPYQKSRNRQRRLPTSLAQRNNTTRPLARLPLEPELKRCCLYSLTIKKGGYNKALDSTALVASCWLLVSSVVVVDWLVDSLASHGCDLRLIGFEGCAHCYMRKAELVSQLQGT